jgi:predicted DsbA family dithiol-disulfide isomerase
MKKTLKIDVWSDIVCPWCAVGKRRLEAALATFPHKDDVEVVWRAFELDPSAPAIQPGDNATRLGQKYGKSRAEAEAMMNQLAATAAKDGLEFHLTTAKSGNTFDGHRVLHLAAERGVQDAVKERFFRGYMTEGQAIGDHAVLTKLAVEAGLDGEEVRAVLASDRYAAEVREEEAAARAMGISGVPFFVFAEKYAVSGAQPAQVLLGALEQAWASLPDGVKTAEGASEGAVCGPEGCA